MLSFPIGYLCLKVDAMSNDDPKNSNLFFQNVHHKLKIPFIIKVAQVESISFKGEHIKNIYVAYSTVYLNLSKISDV